MDNLLNIHPGELLLEEVLKPIGVSESGLARAINVPRHRVNTIVHGRRAVFADTTLRLACYFGTSEGLWMGVQGI